MCKFLNRAQRCWLVYNYAAEILSTIVFCVSECFWRTENSKVKCEFCFNSVIKFPGVFIAFYHIHSWCVHTDCSCFLHQFFGYIGITQEKWILFLNLILPALPKYAIGPWTLLFSSNLWSASLFNGELGMSAFHSLDVFAFLFDWQTLFYYFPKHTISVLKDKLQGSDACIDTADPR